MTSEPSSSTAAPVERRGLLRGGPSAVAGQLLALGYLVGFGISVADAVLALRAGPGGDESSPGDRPAAALGGYVFLLALAMVAAVITMRTAHRRLGITAVGLGLRAASTTRRRAPAAALLYLALLGGAVGLTTAVLAVCGVGDSGVDGGIPNGPGVLPVELFHSAIAGLVEEPVLLAVPVALGRRRRWPWQLTLSLMIAMRIAFHVYEGWDCLFVIPWIVGAFVLYRWCSLLWPFVVAHAAFDVLQTIQTYGGHVAAAVAQTLLLCAVAAGAVIGAVGCRRAGLFDRGWRQLGTAAMTSAATTRNGPNGI